MSRRDGRGRTLVADPESCAVKGKDDSMLRVNRQLCLLMARVVDGLRWLSGIQSLKRSQAEPPTSSPLTQLLGKSTARRGDSTANRRGATDEDADPNWHGGDACRTRRLAGGVRRK